MDDPRERQRRLYRARAVSRAALVIAFGTVLLAAFLFVAAPGYMGGSDTLVPLIGIGGGIGGLAWMIRIYRADPEAGERTWRYREF